MSRLMSEGTHEEVTCSRSWLGESKNQNMQICVEFYDEAEDATITAYLSMSDAAWPYTEKKLAAMGFTLESADYRVGVLDQQDKSPLAGWKGPIVVVNQPYNGKDSFKVDRIGDAGSFQEQMDPAKIAAFEDQFRRKLIAAKGSQTGKPKTAPKAAASKPRKVAAGGGAAPDEDDDVPF